jgi:hypothetical protein
VLRHRSSKEKDARESLVWETLRWVFAPVAVSSFEASTVALSVARLLDG